MARQARKPVVIHTREAWDDTVALLKNTGTPPFTASCIASPAVPRRPPACSTWGSTSASPGW
jgi:Tat protein secretion system quality control protein TatD with DNase activity